MTNQEIIKSIIADQNKTEFAKKHEISRSLLAKWMSGSRTPSVEKIRGIAEKEGYRLIYKVEKL